MENENKVLIHFTNSPFTFTAQNAIFTKPYKDCVATFKMFYDETYQCSKCGVIFYHYYNVCPLCGAKERTKYAGE